MSDLSPQGLSRRESMLAELTAAMTEIHRRRRRRRRAAGGIAGIAVLVLAALAVQLLLSSRSNPNLTPGPDSEKLAEALPVEPSPIDDVEPPCVIRIVRTDPNILKRLELDPEPSVVNLDDDALLAALAALDRPAGLIRQDGKVRLTRMVTDRELRQPPPPDTVNPPL